MPEYHSLEALRRSSCCYKLGPAAYRVHPYLELVKTKTR